MFARKRFQATQIWTKAADAEVFTEGLRIT